MVTQQPSADPAVVAALARNDAYLREAVEKLQLCPFARGSRMGGTLVRQVVVGTDDEDLERRLFLASLGWQESDDYEFEVGLIIAPGYRDGAEAWEALVNRLNNQVEFDMRCRGFGLTCFAVAFHPDMAYGTRSPEQAVGLMRRSPDPTIQLVRRTVLARVRGDSVGPQFLDASALRSPDEALQAAEKLRKPPSVSDRITAANYATWQRMEGGLETLLAGIRARNR